MPRIWVATRVPCLPAVVVEANKSNKTQKSKVPVKNKADTSLLVASKDGGDVTQRSALQGSEAKTKKTSVKSRKSTVTDVSLSLADDDGGDVTHRSALQEITATTDSPGREDGKDSKEKEAGGTEEEVMEGRKTRNKKHFATTASKKTSVKSRQSTETDVSLSLPNQGGGEATEASAVDETTATADSPDQEVGKDSKEKEAGGTEEEVTEGRNTRSKKYFGTTASKITSVKSRQPTVTDVSLSLANESGGEATEASAVEETTATADSPGREDGNGSKEKEAGETQGEGTEGRKTRNKHLDKSLRRPIEPSKKTQKPETASLSTKSAADTMEHSGESVPASNVGNVADGAPVQEKQLLALSEDSVAENTDDDVDSAFQSDDHSDSDSVLSVRSGPRRAPANLFKKKDNDNSDHKTTELETQTALQGMTSALGSHNDALRKFLPGFSVKDYTDQISVFEGKKARVITKDIDRRDLRYPCLLCLLQQKENPDHSVYSCYVRYQQFQISFEKAYPSKTWTERDDERLISVGKFFYIKDTHVIPYCWESKARNATLAKKLYEYRKHLELCHPNSHFEPSTVRAKYIKVKKGEKRPRTAGRTDVDMEKYERNKIRDRAYHKKRRQDEKVLQEKEAK